MDGRTQACQLLIHAQADVNATDECAFPDLCLKFETDFVFFLFMHVTHPPPCRDGRTPLKCAIQLTNKRDVVALLRGVGAAE